MLLDEGFDLGLFDRTVDLEVEPLTHNPLNAVTGAINRLRWSGGHCVRKHVTHDGAGADHWAPSDDPHHFNYWAREAQVYRSGLPQRLGLDAPAVLGVVDRPDGSISLWLEDVAGDSGLDLSISAIAGAARQLGASQGREDQPDEPWLSRDFITAYGASKPVDYSLLNDDATWRHPLVADNWPATLRDDLAELHRSRSWYQQLMTRLPRTVAHLDVWPNNLVVRSDGSAAFLDWSFTGHGVLGEDIGNLVPDAVLDLLVPADDLDELETTVFDAYVEGLAEAGWSGDHDLVRLGFWASAVKYHWLAPVFLERLDAPVHLAYGRPIDPAHLYAERGAALELLARWARDARTLAVELGLD